MFSLTEVDVFSFSDLLWCVESSSSSLFNFSEFSIFSRAAFTSSFEYEMLALWFSATFGLSAVLWSLPVLAWSLKWTTFLCLFNEHACDVLNSHKLQWWSLTLLCTDFVCLLKMLIFVALKLHSSQCQSLILSWTAFLCLLISLSLDDLYSHWSQLLSLILKWTAFLCDLTRKASVASYGRCSLFEMCAQNDNLT